MLVPGISVSALILPASVSSTSPVKTSTGSAGWSPMATEFVALMMASSPRTPSSVRRRMLSGSRPSSSPMVVNVSVIGSSMPVAFVMLSVTRSRVTWTSPYL